MTSELLTNELSASELNYLFDFIQERSAILLDDTKDYLIYNRLMPLLKLHKLPSFSNLIEVLKQQQNANVINDVVDALAASETLFFRDYKPFELLKTYLLPKIIHDKGNDRSLRIWSAACSTGQEPYSLAMLLREEFPKLNDWDIKIFASDINSDSLSKAESGCYSQIDVNRGLPAKYLVKYFLNEKARWKVKSSIREMVDFQQLNFVDPWPEMEKFDVIFLRNVLLYFGANVKKDILERMADVMSVGSFMFLGSSESLIRLNVPFKTIILDNGRCFQKK